MFCQNDPKWAEQKLGTSSDTLAKSGCKVTCFAEILSRWGYKFTPSTLDKLFTRRFYVDSCLLTDEVLPQMFPWLEMQQSIYENKLADLTKLQKAYNEEIVIRLQLKRTHFVLLEKIEVNKIFIADPASGKIEDLAQKHGQPETIITKITKYSNPLQDIPVTIRKEGEVYAGFLKNGVAFGELRNLFESQGQNVRWQGADMEAIISDGPLEKLRDIKMIVGSVI